MKNDMKNMMFFIFVFWIKFVFKCLHFFNENQAVKLLICKIMIFYAVFYDIFISCFIGTSRWFPSHVNLTFCAYLIMISLNMHYCSEADLQGRSFLCCCSCHFMFLSNENFIFIFMYLIVFVFNSQVLYWFIWS